MYIRTNAAEQCRVLDREYLKHQNSQKSEIPTSQRFLKVRLLLKM